MKTVFVRIQGWTCFPVVSVLRLNWYPTFPISPFLQLRSLHVKFYCLHAILELADSWRNTGQPTHGGPGDLRTPSEHLTMSPRTMSHCHSQVPLYQAVRTGIIPVPTASNGNQQTVTPVSVPVWRQGQVRAGKLTRITRLESNQGFQYIWLEIEPSVKERITRC